MNRARRAMTSGVIAVGMLVALSPSPVLADRHAPGHVTQVQVERSVAAQVQPATAPPADVFCLIGGILQLITGTNTCPSGSGGNSTRELPAGALLGIALVPAIGLWLRMRRRRRQ